VSGDHQTHDGSVTTRLPPTRRPGLVVLAGIVAISVTWGWVLVAVLTSSHFSPGAGWVRVGSVEDVRAEGVTSVPQVPAYVVADPPRTPITLLAVSPHLGERITYCTSSGWFEDLAHGAKFDREGNYRLGPAEHGLDRLATLVRDGVVWVNPSEITPGPAKGSSDGIPPAGPFCQAST
jgi:hypothetical protein